MQLCLALTPVESREPGPRSRLLAHVAYRLGKGVLLRQDLPLGTRGGFLSLSDRDAPPVTAPAQMASMLLRECAQRGYSGVIADFEHSPTPDRVALLQALLRRKDNAFQLLVPEAFSLPGATVLVNTAVSGGSVAERLREAIRQYPSAALDLQRAMMDFTLPAPSGEGKPLTVESLAELRRQLAPTVFFSPELCARYFTYTQNGQTHFVLFDDAETLRQKMRIAEPMGYRLALVMYPEVKDLLTPLFGPGTR